MKHHQQELQIDVLYILINEMFQSIMEHMINTNYKYSIAAAKTLTDHIRYWLSYRFRMVLNRPKKERSREKGSNKQNRMTMPEFI